MLPFKFETWRELAFRIFFGNIEFFFISEYLIFLIYCIMLVKLASKVFSNFPYHDRQAWWSYSKSVP